MAKKTTASKTAPTSEPADLAKRYGEDVVDIEIGKIIVDRHQDRIGEPKRIIELADSIREHGLLCPIIVTPAGKGFAADEFRLVAGGRRLKAVASLGWSSVRATIRRLDDETNIRVVRAVENLDREDLNPIEQAIVVEDMIANVISDAGTGTLQDREAEAISKVADLLGRPVRWVRDRAFLASLEGEPRRLVMEGILPIAYAREITLLASGEEREEAVEFVTGAFPADPALCTLDEIRQYVRERLQNLTRVPWSLKAEFEGLPACSDCPNNSANSPGLFEGESTRDPVCRLKSCYDQKTKAVKLTVDAAARKITKRLSPSDIASGQPSKLVKKIDLDDATYEACKTVLGDDACDLVAARAKDMLDRKATASKAQTPPKAVSSKQQVMEKYQHAYSVWFHDHAVPAALARRSESPSRWFLVMHRITTATEVVGNWYYQTDKKQIERFRAEVKEAGSIPKSPGVAAIHSAISQLLASMDRPFETQWFGFDFDQMHKHGLIGEILDAFDVVVDEPAPKLEDFMPKKATAAPPPPAKPAAKKTTTKKKTAKKKTSAKKRPAVSKGGAS